MSNKFSNLILALVLSILLVACPSPTPTPPTPDPNSVVVPPNDSTPPMEVGLDVYDPDLISVSKTSQPITIFAISDVVTVIAGATDEDGGIKAVSLWATYTYYKPGQTSGPGLATAPIKQVVSSATVGGSTPKNPFFSYNFDLKTELGGWSRIKIDIWVQAENFYGGKVQTPVVSLTYPTDPCPDPRANPHVFNPTYYVAHYADLKGYSPQQACEHWLNVGIAEGRQASPSFHVLEYLRQYPDLVAAYGWRGFAEGVTHYVTRVVSGIEQRKGLMPQPSSLPGIKIGIVYEPWQCMFPDWHSGPAFGANYNITEILQHPDPRPWGPVYAYHWWDEPALGYYCLTYNLDVLYQHAVMLRDAGIDFVIIDSTNSPYTQDEDYRKVVNSDGYWYELGKPLQMIEQPVVNLLAVWSSVPNAPKIVPWLPIHNYPKPEDKTSRGEPCPNPDMPVFFDAQLHPGSGPFARMGFIYDGKPLWLANSAGVADENIRKCLGATTSDPEAIDAYSRVYTIRKMWAFQPIEPTEDPPVWSFMQNCQDHFQTTGGIIDCDQRVARFKNGVPEQVSVTSAYQAEEGYLSDRGAATPKFGGKTLSAQMATVWNYQQARVLTIEAWNEWGGVRFGCVPDIPCSHSTDLMNDGSGIFMDGYAGDYNRDLEPSMSLGDQYYQQLKTEIANVKGPLALPVPAIGSILGQIDGVANGVLTGWACAHGVANSIYVDVYVGGPYPLGQGTAHVLAALLPQSQEDASAIASACGIASGAFRFSFPMDASFRQQHFGKSIFVHGIAPAGFGEANLLLSDSALYKVPPP